MKKVAIVVLHYSGEKDTFECLESIKKLHVPNFELLVIVVDNGVEDKLKINDVKIIRNKHNLGFAGGNNVGIKYAISNGADYILILNNDTVVDKNLVQELVKIAESEKKIGIVVPKIYFAKGFEFHKGRYIKEDLGKVIWYAGGIIDWRNIIGRHKGVDEVDHGQYEKIEETMFASGCCMMIKRAVLDKVGLFDDKYFLYYEDADISMKIKKAGYTIMYAPKAILWHKNAGSAGGSGSPLQDYYITRNRMLFGMRYAPFRSKVALIRQSIGLLLQGRHWQKRGIFDFYIYKFGKGYWT